MEPETSETEDIELVTRKVYEILYTIRNAKSYMVYADSQIQDLEDRVLVGAFFGPDYTQKIVNEVLESLDRFKKDFEQAQRLMNELLKSDEFGRARGVIEKLETVERTKSGRPILRSPTEASIRKEVDMFNTTVEQLRENGPAILKVIEQAERVGNAARLAKTVELLGSYLELHQDSFKQTILRVLGARRFDGILNSCDKLEKGILDQMNQVRTQQIKEMEEGELPSSSMSR